jgi:hypothetical protein
MSTEIDRPASKHHRSTLTWMGPTAVALLAALVLLGVERDGPAQPTVTAVPERSVAASALDHSVLDRRDLAAAAEPSLLSVAAYGD